MKLSFRPAVLTLSVALASSSAMAADPIVIGCAKGSIPAQLSLTLRATATFSDECPLLEDKELRKLVDKFGAGTVFAYPLIPGTCLSGSEPDGTLTTFLPNGSSESIEIDESSYSESAQRLFPVPANQGFPGLPGGQDLFATSNDGGETTPPSLQAGAAMTAVHLKAGQYNFDLLLDDHFLLTGYGAVDTEDFLVVGSRGSHRVSGRLSGRGEIVAGPPAGPLTIDLTVEGSLCLQQ